MKTIGISIMIVICSIGIVFGQNALSARAILDNVNKNYSSYKTIKADFTLTGKNEQNSSNYNEKGRVYLVPGSGKYKIEMESHALISDGKTQWSVLKDLDEVQISDVNPNDQSINPSNIFSFYKNGYQVKKNADMKVSGIFLHVVELTPIDVNQNVSKIEMRINQTNFIYDVTIFDKSGSKYTYTLTNLETNKTFSNGIFNFYKHNYPEIEVVDLR